MANETQIVTPQAYSAKPTYTLGPTPEPSAVPEDYERFEDTLSKLAQVPKSGVDELRRENA